MASAIDGPKKHEPFNESDSYFSFYSVIKPVRYVLPLRIHHNRADSVRYRKIYPVSAGAK
jgi:hypothetical protein